MSDVRRMAVFSEDMKYRYSLVRDWGMGRRAVFVMLNPSIADGDGDDPTVRRCMGFARDWSCTGIEVVNLYALVSTDPKGLWTADDPIGPDNDSFIRTAARYAQEKNAPLIAAWGANAKPERVRQVLTLPGMARVHHLGLTKARQPKHPLYLRKDTRPTPLFIAGGFIKGES